MSPLDAFWHLLNFFAPAAFIGLFTASAAKLIWRHELRNLGWRALLAWAIVPAIAAAVVGLVITGRDGTLLAYAAMVGAAASGLWIAGMFRKRG